MMVRKPGSSMIAARTGECQSSVCNTWRDHRLSWLWRRFVPSLQTQGGGM